MIEKKTRIVEIEHIRLRSPASVEVVQASLERTIPQLDTGLFAMLRNGDHAAVIAQRNHGSKLWIFSNRDHGSLLRISGRSVKAWQYEIGNPITAASMTEHVMSAGLYAPLRVLLYETEDGGSAFEYDLPSSLFGQFGDDRVVEVGHSLDDELEHALMRALAV